MLTYSYTIGFMPCKRFWKKWQYRLYKMYVPVK